jgi:PPOX class probable F420-dependent enzyme
MLPGTGKNKSMIIGPTPPPSHLDLLERPLFAHLATVRPDGAPQSNVMWFAWDGTRIRMTHTRMRQKFQNLQREPRVALSIADPEDPYRFIEVRGSVESIDDDDVQASFYRSLQVRYGKVYDIADAPVRVIVTIRPESFVTVTGGRARRRT